MRALGWPEARILHELPTLGKKKTIDVHPDNWTAVMVFRACTMPSIAAPSSLLTVDLSVVEIESAARTYGIALHPRLMFAVKYLGNVTAKLRNAKASSNSPPPTPPRN